MERKSLRNRLKAPELKTPLRWTLTGVLLVASALGLLALNLMLSTLDFSRGRFSSYFHMPVTLALNFLPIVLLMAACYFITNRAWLSFLLPSVLVVVVDLINYFKIALRGDPLVAEDLLTVFEAAGTVGDYELNFPAWSFIAFALLIIGTLVLMRYARGRMPKRLWWVRIIALAACIGLGAMSWILWYSDESVYFYQQNYSLFNSWKVHEKYASHGTIYSFLNSVNDVVTPAPEGYSAEKAEQILSRYEDADIDESQKVNVIVTMLESFSDLSVFEEINFTQDAYTAFHALQEESYCGTLVTDTIGGGTVNAERAFLTGFTYPQPQYNKDTNSFVRYFSAQGYFTDGSHPGWEWFYNRQRINERLGFDRYLLNESYYDAVSEEAHATDETLFQELRSIYEEQDTPYFSFSVTYQNHSPYDDSQLLGEEYVSRDGLTDEAYYTVNNYLSGVADTGEQIAAYVDTFRDDPEPVVLVFFGDHKPSLGAAYEYYEMLGIDLGASRAENAWNLCTTPYLIWANDAAKAVLDGSFEGQGATISPAFLMTEVFDCCGWTGPAWLQFQREVRETVPVVQSMGFCLHDGALTETLTPEEQAVYDEFAIVQYYLRKNFLPQ